jgi:hypothetical protein
VTGTVALAAAAGATSTIELTSTVLLATVWPGALPAKELAGINGVSGGRITIGLGIGGRAGEPRLVGIAYYAVGDVDRGRANIHDYYSFAGDFADRVAAGLSGGPDAIRATRTAFEEIGATDLIFNPGTADPDEVERLADLVR